MATEPEIMSELIGRGVEIAGHASLIRTAETVLRVYGHLDALVDVLHREPPPSRRRLKRLQLSLERDRRLLVDELDRQRRELRLSWKALENRASRRRGATSEAL